MRTRILLTLGIAGACLAQQKTFVVNAETPEGKILQEFAQESDVPKRIAIADRFLAEHPTHEGVIWLLKGVEPSYVQAGEFDKAMDAAAKIVAAEPDSVEAAYQGLKAAEGKKDAAAIIQWSNKTSELAKKVASSKMPEGMDQEEWKKRIDYVTQVDGYTEYALSAAALQASNADAMNLIDALAARNPKSQYLAQAKPKYLAAIQAAPPAEQGAVAERYLKVDPNSEEALLLAANAAMTGKNHEKSIANATRLAAVLKDKPKPEGVSDADWEKRKALLLGRAYWIAGMEYAAESKLKEADEELRASLPYVRSDDTLYQTALFNLGLANYKMAQGGKRALASDAMKFNQQAAAVKGPLAAQAAKNARVIQTEFKLQ